MSAACSISVSSRPPRLSSASSSLRLRRERARQLQLLQRRRRPARRRGDRADRSAVRPAPAPPRRLLGLGAARSRGPARRTPPGVDVLEQCAVAERPRDLERPRRCPCGRSRFGGSPVISCALERIEPAARRVEPGDQLNVVLLPEPFGPIRPRISPSASSNETLVDRREAAEALGQAPDLQQRRGGSRGRAGRGERVAASAGVLAATGSVTGRRQRA